jgi:DNA repair exonuclease SbcCD ATPase subunit
MGENGEGKSSCVVDTIYYALFGRTYRKQKLDQIVNWINKKELEVELRFKVRGRKVRIERGMRPDYLRVYTGDAHMLDEDLELVPVESASRKYQKIIEEDILHMNEGVFNQTVIKSMTKNISFMTLEKYFKRQVTESIFGIEIFTHMNELAHQKLLDTKADIDSILKDIEYVKNQISQELSNIESLKQIQEKITKEQDRKMADMQLEMDENREKMAQYDIGIKKISKHHKLLEGLEKDKKLITDDARIKKQEKKELDASLAVSIKKLELFQNMCPECPKVKAMIEDDDIADNKAQAKILGEELSVLKTRFEDIQEQIKKSEKIVSNETPIRSMQKEAQRKMDKLQAEMQKEMSAEEMITIDETKLKELKFKRNEFEVDYNAKNKLKKHLIIMKSLLADEGIKSFIIKRYLPHVNKILNTYLQKFNTDILFYFDTEFNEVIGSRYKENANYHCFSEGQKRRIDMAILFTFLEFCKIKNRKSETNLLILDEITGGVDAAGENILYDILREMANKENKEIITISHSGNIDPEKIDRLYNAKIEGGFSNLRQLES